MEIWAIVGLQWGDEGKGKLTDALAGEVGAVARYQGGDNAGHTLVIDGKKLVLHAVPSGLVRGIPCALGPGMVVNLKALRGELLQLQEQGITSSPELLCLARETQLILPWHTELDGAREQTSANPIGTTRRGIGPAYEDKAARRGLRAADLLDLDRLHSLVKERGELAERQLAMHNCAAAWSVPSLMEELAELASYFRPFIADVRAFLERCGRNGRPILLEGAQGVLLDIEHGQYPYVTSSHILPLAGQASLGLSRHKLTRVIGVAKAYATRVGTGPFPTEDLGEAGALLQSVGAEFGATTGRKRRCGWLDLPLLRRAAELAGATELAVTKLDVLSSFEEIKLANTYQEGASFEEAVPGGRDSQPVPCYQAMRGWKKDLSSCRLAWDLPDACRNYLSVLAVGVGLPVSYASVGPEREALVRL